MSNNLLDVVNLKVSFGTDSGPARVLDGVNLSIDHGQIVGLVGESGCGKTTLARAILGTLPKGSAQISAGSTITFDGEELPPASLPGPYAGAPSLLFPRTHIHLSTRFSPLAPRSRN